MIMSEGLKIKIEGVKVELRGLFPQGEIDLLHGQNHDYDDYMLLVTSNKKRVGFLLIRCYAEDEILEVHLFKDSQYQANKNSGGISWFRSEDGKYKKPANHEELERFLNHVWGILT